MLIKLNQILLIILKEMGNVFIVYPNLSLQMDMILNVNNLQSDFDKLCERLKVQSVKLKHDNISGAKK